MPSEIEVIRSPRRHRTVQARVVGEKVVVRIPARMTVAEEEKAVAEIVAKLRRKTTSTRTSDEQLLARAGQLNRELLDARAVIGSIRWVSNQTTRWGSCSVATGDIRITDRLRHVPDYVLDAVILHELVHTFIPGHGQDFWGYADRAPRAERAKGYLEAYQRFG
ncbi:M48 family metallopeptidase [Corynebacterium comes]|uniref:YgjP-like metallopeptidase domain-containing protein n=1 Tax=Corynebacterium comes TaxID=2675218 RepID=A0A6B8VV62_9CORY|nr:YgjP-like metallopeptidase domain-containing protein [Corynebacterium comes]QGU03951.1 hypothetical protein CETAM_03355 [Corynebacterium comes]